MELLVNCATHKAAWMGALLLSMLAWPAYAKDTLQAYVEIQRLWDDNLLRTETDTLKGAIDITRAGVGLDWRLGRQQLTGHVSATQVRYPDLALLDYDGYALDWQWNWQTVNGVSGVLGCNENLTQSSLIDIQSVLSNLRTQRRCQSEIVLNPSGKWKTSLVLFDSQSLNSEASQQIYDWRETGVEGKLSLTSSPGNHIDGFMRAADGTFPNKQSVGGLLVDNSYHQQEIGLQAGYRLGGATQLYIRTAYLQRKQVQERDRDFDGVAGRVSLDLQPTGKTSLSGAIYRNVGAVEDLNASYIVTDGISMSSVWTPFFCWRLSLKITSCMALPSIPIS